MVQGISLECLLHAEKALHVLSLSETSVALSVVLGTEFMEGGALFTFWREAWGIRGITVQLFLTINVPLENVNLELPLEHLLA